MDSKTNKYKCPDNHVSVEVNNNELSKQIICPQCNKKLVIVEKEHDLTIVDGEHIAKGKGNITGLEINKPVIIRPGTKASAEGEGNVTGTKIG